MFDLRSLTPTLTIAVAMLTAGCGAETAETRVSFELELAANTRSRGPMTSEDGYAVTVQDARLRVGAIRFYSGEPLFAHNGNRRTVPRWRWRPALQRLLQASSLAGTLTSVPAAHAHPGHYQEGDTLAEWLDGANVDILAVTPVRLGTALGVSGSYRSMLVTLRASEGSVATLQLAGEAVKGGRKVTFSAQLDYPREVRGIAVDPQIASAAQGRTRIEVDLQTVLERVRFDDLDDGAHVIIATGSQAENALLRGLSSTDAFTATWQRTAR